MSFSTKTKASDMEQGGEITKQYVERLCLGDPEAWSQFVTLYSALVRRYLVIAFFRLGRVRFPPVGESSEHLVLDAFGHIYESLSEKFKKWEGEWSFRRYIYNCITYFSSKWLKERNLYRRSPLDVRELSGGDSDTVHSEDQEILGMCLELLHDKHHEVIHLYFFSGARLTQKEIAHLTQTSSATAHKRYKQALTQLKKCIERRGKRLRK